MSYSIKELFRAINEVGREVGMRKSCYPKWVERGTIDRIEADRRLNNMQIAYQILKELYSGVIPEFEREQKQEQEQQLTIGV